MLPDHAVYRKESAVQSARKVGLRYVSDVMPGLRREPHRQWFPLHGCRRPWRARQGNARTHEVAGYPAGLDRRLDMRRAQRSYPGHRARCPGPEAVSLSSAVAPGSRREQIRAPDLLRQGIALDPQPGGQGSGVGRIAARKNPGHDRAVAGDDDDARGQRGVRAQQRLVWPDDAARQARQHRRRSPGIPFPWQERR